MTAQTKRATNEEVNSLLLGKGSNKRRATSKNKALRALKLGGPEEEKRSKNRIPFKVWKMLRPEAKADLRRGDEVKIGLVQDNAVNTGSPRGGGGGYVPTAQEELEWFSTLDPVGGS